MTTMTVGNIISQLQAIGEDIKAGIFDENPEPKQLLAVVLAMAAFWAVAFKIMEFGFYLLIRHEPEWIIRTADRDYHRGGKKMAETFGMDSSPEGCRKQFLLTWPFMQALVIQHFVGGMLCVPAVFNLMPNNPALSTSLACLAILSEMGWEIEDMITWIYRRYCTENGKEKVHIAFLIVVAMHHSLGMSLGAPLILHYRNVRTLHWLCFDLQFASAICLGVAEYTKLLDLSIPSHLKQFQVLATFALVSAVWARLIHWVYLVGEFMILWYSEQAYSFLVAGGLLGTVFSMFSYAIVIEPCYKRWHKFCLRKKEYEQVLENKAATKQQRRSSFLALDEAAGEMLVKMEGDMAISEMVAQYILQPREVIDRRASLPASLKLGSERRRSSFLRFLQDPDSSLLDEDQPPARRATFNGDESLSDSMRLAADEYEKDKDQ